MKRTLRTLAFHVNRALGPAGWLGLVLLIVSLATLWHLEHVGTPRLESARQSLALARIEAQRVRTLASQPVRIETVDGSLPHRGELPAILAELQRMAATMNVEVAQATYSFAKGSRTAPAQIEMTVPLKGKYGVIRPYLMMTLNAVPALALREISFRRSATDQAELDVFVRWVLFVRETPQ